MGRLTQEDLEHGWFAGYYPLELPKGCEKGMRACRSFRFIQYVSDWSIDNAKGDRIKIVGRYTEPQIEYLLTEERYRRKKRQ